MTADKDFKRVVRARAQRTGEAYSTALHNLRNSRRGSRAAGDPAASDKEHPPMNIVRTIPEIRSTDLDRSRQFYVDLLGFDLCMEEAEMLMFCSPSHSWVQVILNGEHGEPLPPGFSVDVDTPDAVASLYERAGGNGVRVVEPMDDKPWGIRRFSVLDNSGTCVTVLSHLNAKDRKDHQNTRHPIQLVRAVPTVRSRTREESRDFYVKYLGFDVCMDQDHMIMFCSPSHPRVQVEAHDDLSGPPGFLLDVGNVARVDDTYERAVAAGFTILRQPFDVGDMIHTFTVLDPNGTAVSVLAHLDTAHQTG